MHFRNLVCELICNSPILALSKVMKVWLQTRMELVCAVPIYHSVKKSYENMLWCSNNRADGAVGTYSPSNHEGTETDDLSANDNNFMHYVL